jgi:hypothetical protein
MKSVGSRKNNARSPATLRKLVDDVVSTVGVVQGTKIDASADCLVCAAREAKRGKAAVSARERRGTQVVTACTPSSKAMACAVRGEIGAVRVAEALERGCGVNAEGLTGGCAQRGAGAHRAVVGEALVEGGVPQG